MKLSSVVLLNVAGTLGSPNGMELAFDAYATRFQKTYSSPEERAQRLSVYVENMKYIDEHNKGDSSFKMGETPFTDLTFEEFHSRYATGIDPEVESVAPAVDVHRKADGRWALERSDLPLVVDWRNHSVVSPVKNQGACGGCWAFSATQALESLHAFVDGTDKRGNVEQLSVQEVLSCSHAYGEYNCNGGSAGLAFAWVYNNKGISTADDYPLEDATTKSGKSYDCEPAKETKSFAIDSYHKTVRGSNGLKTALSYQPVSVGMVVSGKFQHYVSGIFEDRSCSLKYGSLSHAVLAVGYSNASQVKGENYFVIKNSWSTNWGENGYVRLAFDGKFKYYYGDDGACSVAAAGYYPTKQGGPSPVGPPPPPVQWCDDAKSMACPSTNTCCDNKDMAGNDRWACCPLVNATCCHDFYCCEPETPVCHPDAPKGQKCQDSFGFTKSEAAIRRPAVKISPATIVPAVGPAIEV